MRVNHQALVATAPATLRQVRPIKNFNAGQTPGGFIKEFGAHFAPGDVPAGSILEWRKSDGTVMPSQGDNRVTWQAGQCPAPSVGSLRSVSVAAFYPSTIAAGASDVLKGYATAGSWPTTSWAGVSVLTSKDIKLEVDLLTQITQTIGTGDGTNRSFSGTVAPAPLRPNTISVSWITAANTPIQVLDDGNGGWQVRGQLAPFPTSGSINYTTGAITVLMAGGFQPKAGSPVNIIYATAADSGTTYTLGATNEITRATNVRQMRSGPVSVGWRLFGELRLGTGINATPQGDLWAHLYLTFFLDGSHTIHGKINNGRFTQSTASAKLIAGYRLIVSGATTYNRAVAFKMFAGCPVRTLDANGLQYCTDVLQDKCVVGFPTMTLGDPTTTGLYDSKNLWWIVSSPTMIANLATTNLSAYNWSPNFQAPQSDGAINGTGAHQFVGTISGWAITAMLAKDWNSLRGDRITSYSIDPARGGYNDATAGVGYPGNLTNGTVYSGLGTSNKLLHWGIEQQAPFIATTGGAPYVEPTPTLDGSHAGLWAHYQYLATGQEPFLDAMGEQIIAQLGYVAPVVDSIHAGRNPILNGIQFYTCYQIGGRSGGIRNGAWNLRNVDNSAWLSPDPHPMKPYLTDILTANLEQYAEWVRPPNSPVEMATLGMYMAGGEPNVRGWMDDFLTLSLSTSIWRGRISTSHNFITFHTVKWSMGRHLAPACPWSGTQYTYGAGPGATPGGVSASAPGPGAAVQSYGPPYTGNIWPQSWSEVWIRLFNNNPDSGPGQGFNSVPFSQPTTNGPSNGACPGTGVSGPFVVGFNYAVIGLCATVTAKLMAIPTADDAYTYLEAAMVAAPTNTEVAWAGIYTCNWRIDTPR